MRDVFFWQSITSPHIVGLADAMARRGCRVTFVSQQAIAPERAALGWEAPASDVVDFVIAPTREATIEVATNASQSAIHITQGLRSNGLVSVAQGILDARAARLWVAMETVDDSGLAGVARRWEYQRQFLRWRSHIEGVLSIGHVTERWVVARGMRADKVFPFAYFLPLASTPTVPRQSVSPFRFIFVGQFIARKQLDFLIRGLSGLPTQDFEFVVIGAGPLGNRLRALAETAMPGRVRWIGRLPSTEVSRELASADCLILPSRHDGWGAVASEALMVGTPVVCTDTCGVAEVVRKSGSGGVFPRSDVEALKALLSVQWARGPVGAEARYALAGWAECLGADAGADYLLAILAHAEIGLPRPRAPWMVDPEVSICAA